MSVVGRQGKWFGPAIAATSVKGQQVRDARGPRFRRWNFSAAHRGFRVSATVQFALTDRAVQAPAGR
jgi:hypothetical protein